MSRRDMVQALATTDERMRREIDDLLQEIGYGAWAVTVEDCDVVIHTPGAASQPDPRDVHLAETLARTVLGVRTVRVVGDQPVGAPRRRITLLPD